MLELRLRSRGLTSFLLTALATGSIAVAQERKVPVHVPRLPDVKTERTDSAATNRGAPAPDARREMSSPPASAATTRKCASARVSTSRLDRVIFDEPGDGRTWAVGETYKAGFGPDGLCFIPFFGARAPRDFPVMIRTSSLASGSGTCVPVATSTPVRDGDLITFDRGTFRERYRLGLRSVEQEFVLTERPPEGDLVLRLAVASELSRRESADALLLENALGHVSYDRAVALDARGLRTALSTRFVDGGIEITVPSSCLSDAQMPVTIDPLFQIFTVDGSTFDDTQADVAFDINADVYGVSWERVFSASDHDIYCQLQDINGNTIAGSTVSIDSTPYYWAHPRIANNSVASQFLVVGERDPGSGVRQIWGRERDAGSTTQSSQFQISDPSIAYDQFDADVGGDPATVSPTYYCVTWERAYAPGDHDIFAALVDVGATMHTSTIFVDNSSLTLDEHPTISKTDGNPPFASQNWTITRQRWAHPSDHDLYGAQLRWDGAATNPSFLIDSSSNDDRNPTVSTILDDVSGVAPARNYVVACERSVSSDDDIQVFLMNGAALLGQADLNVAEGPLGLAAQDQILPCADSDGCEFIVAYSELLPSSATVYNVFVSSLTGFSPPSGHIVVTEPHVQMSGFNLANAGVQLAANRTAGDYDGSRRAAAVWTSTYSSTDHDIYGALYDSEPRVMNYCVPGVDGVRTCPCSNPPGIQGRGCNNSAATGGAALTAVGIARLSADTFTLQQFGELPSAFSIFVQGNADVPAGIATGNGVRCAGGALKRLYAHHASGGAVSAPSGTESSVHVQSAAKGDPISPCSTRIYEVYYRDPAGGCSTFDVGSALQVTWVP